MGILISESSLGNHKLQAVWQRLKEQRHRQLLCAVLTSTKIAIDTALFNEGRGSGCLELFNFESQTFSRSVDVGRMWAWERDKVINNHGAVYIRQR